MGLSSGAGCIDEKAELIIDMCHEGEYKNDKCTGENTPFCISRYGQSSASRMRSR